MQHTLSRPSCLSLFIVFALLFCCSCQKDFHSQMIGQQVFPIYFDPAHAFQIFTKDDGSFPFEPGDQVEIAATLILHTIPNPEILNILPGVTWYASLYPYGIPVSNDSIQVYFAGESPGLTYSLVWPLDNDDVLLLLSDTLLPAALFHRGNAGDSRVVCLWLQVSQVERIELGGSRVLHLTLRPLGKKKDGLILSDIYLCRDD